jgi:hypothetical protein
LFAWQSRQSAPLIDAIEKFVVFLGDRGYNGYLEFYNFIIRQKDFIIRAKDKSRKRYIKLKKPGKNDYSIKLLKPSGRPENYHLLTKPRPEFNEDPHRGKRENS